LIGYNKTADYSQYKLRTQGQWECDAIGYKMPNLHWKSIGTHWLRSLIPVAWRNRGKLSNF